MTYYVKLCCGISLARGLERSHYIVTPELRQERTRAQGSVIVESLQQVLLSCLRLNLHSERTSFTTSHAKVFPLKCCMTIK